MPSPTEEVLCTYRYDALDRLTGLKPDKQDDLQRFYCNNRLVTEIQGQDQISIMQQGEQLLAQQHRAGATVETDLLVTDQQRSVLQTMGSLPSPRIAYSAYGHRSAASGLTSLLGFNGERPDTITGRYLLGNGHRAFSPTLMRFDSPDNLSPFGQGGLNTYAYCVGDPVNRRDPTGNIPIRFPRPIRLPIPAPVQVSESLAWFELDTIALKNFSRFSDIDLGVSRRSLGSQLSKNSTSGSSRANWNSPPDASLKGYAPTPATIEGDMKLSSSKFAYKYFHDSLVSVDKASIGGDLYKRAVEWDLHEIRYSDVTLEILNAGNRTRLAVGVKGVVSKPNMKPSVVSKKSVSNPPPPILSPTEQKNEIASLASLLRR